jgi:hypothetical protein
MRRKCLLVIVAMTTFSIVSVLPASLAQGGPSLIGQEGSTPTEVFHGTVYSS